MHTEAAQQLLSMGLRFLSAHLNAAKTGRRPPPYLGLQRLLEAVSARWSTLPGRLAEELLDCILCLGQPHIHQKVRCVTGPPTLLSGGNNEAKAS